MPMVVEINTVFGLQLPLCRRELKGVAWWGSEEARYILFHTYDVRLPFMLQVVPASLAKEYDI